MPSTILSTLLMGSVLVTSIPPLYFSITASQLLLNYEDMTKKAAKYSNEAERQLWKTRKTQGSAVLATATSTLSVLYLLYARVTSSDPLWHRSIMLAAANSMFAFGSEAYLRGFWHNTARVPVPGAGKYNDGVRATEQAMVWFNYVGVLWGGLAGALLVGF